MLIRSATGPPSFAPAIATRCSLLLPFLPVAIAVPLGTVYLWSSDSSHAVVLALGLVALTAALTRQLVLLEHKRRLFDAVIDAAQHDHLTGLSNASQFDDRFRHAMTLHVRDGAPVSVIAVRADSFSMVNATLGYLAGEALLRSVAQHIANIVPSGGTVVHLAGERFAVLVEDDVETARVLAARISDAFAQPVDVAGNSLEVSVSAGVAGTTPGSASTPTAQELLAQAEAESTRTSRLRRCESPVEPGQQQRDGVVRVNLAGQLRRAIQGDELALVYQPKVSLTAGDVVGVEALLRWPHPALGVLDPGEFLSLAAEFELLDAIDDWVLGRALDDAATWYRRGTQVPVAINLSGRAVTQPSLSARVAAALADRGLPSRALTVELTEHQLVGNFDTARSVLAGLQALGVRIAIDDFGSGYANMTYLHELPVDGIKIDAEFVMPMLTDARAERIVRSILDLAATFELEVTAEGVENGAVARRLRELGCEYAQGYYFGRPVPRDQLLFVSGSPRRTAAPPPERDRATDAPSHGPR